MSKKFTTLLTEIGAAKLANATALGVPLNITQMAVGDGNGQLPEPNAKQTQLVSEKRRAALNQLYIDPQNDSQIIAEQVIPESEGGWWIREVGLFDESDTLIAVGNCPESYKPVLNEGSGRTQTVRMILATSGTDNITLDIDPAVVLATRKYVDDQFIELNKYKEKMAAGTFIIGMPFFWPSEKMPNELLPEWAEMEFLKWNGATFSASKYPKLALIIPSLKLSEARGEFPRIWDDGRGVDNGRKLLSTQAHGMPKLTGQFQSYDLGGYEGASGIFTASKFSDNSCKETTEKGNGTDIRVSMDSSTVTPEANEVRPRSIAFNFLVRAK
ncbi:phage tail protein [Rosenbergiella nectarea]|uniref:phage tail protein n=1 Tax=Rosenbergiella nectarea TaxID=988801 RepID=UPI001F4DFDC5|nr:phage tail protein [Rosenbergiella nectarea]